LVKSRYRAPWREFVTRCLLQSRNIFIKEVFEFFVGKHFNETPLSYFSCSVFSALLIGICRKLAAVGADFPAPCTTTPMANKNCAAGYCYENHR
jgi:hypothetical protein